MESDFDIIVRSSKDEGSGSVGIGRRARLRIL